VSDVSRNLIRIWVAKYEAGKFNEDVEAADYLQEYEARIAAFERLVGKLTLENEFLTGLWGRPGLLRLCAYSTAIAVTAITLQCQGGCV
jgi:hypothetical protein